LKGGGGGGGGFISNIFWTIAVKEQQLSMHYM
jgi:hypothetical protein